MENRFKVKDIIIIIILLVACLVVGYFISTIEKYKRVSFDTNGGESMSSIQVSKGSKVGSIKDPTREGYTFQYWKVDGEAVDDNYIIKKDIHLVAVWKKDKDTSTKDIYTVTFDSNGGSSVDSQEVIAGEKALKPSNPVKDGYIFNGWMLGEKIYDFDLSVTKDILLKADWKKVDDGSETTPSKPSPPPTPSPSPAPEQKTFTVTFDSDGGSSVASQKVKEGNKAIKPSNPTKSGYTFNQWTLNGKTYNFDTVITQNITLKATWSVATKQVCRDIFYNSLMADPVIWINNKTNLKNYKSGTDYKSSCSGLYLKYDTQNNIVKNTYLVFSDWNLSLKGGNSYANNKALLIKAFGSKNCLEDGNSEYSFDGLYCRVDKETAFYIGSVARNGDIDFTIGYTGYICPGCSSTGRVDYTQCSYSSGKSSCVSERVE